MLTPSERVEKMLRRESVDRIPFTAYENKVPPGRSERELRNDGLCIVQRHPNFYRVSTPNCRTDVCHVCGSGRTAVHTRVETPKGALTASDVQAADGGGMWRSERFFSGPRDYAALKAYIEDQIYIAGYEAVREKMAESGGDYFMRGQIDYSPMHKILYDYMGVERFAYEWQDHRTAVLELYEILRCKYRELYPIAAAAPELAINMGGNVSANVVSPLMFQEYYLPVYNEAAEILHRGGKLMGVHFDGYTLPYARCIADSALDYIEALTPPPTCDVGVAQAHSLWPDKAIWINFPSTVHVSSEKEIAAVTRRILEQCRPEKGFLLGITEDVPPDRWSGNFRVILDTVNRHVIDWSAASGKRPNGH